MAELSDSILDTIKQMSGIASTETTFDTDIITNINTSFMILNQLGVGPDEPFHIEDSEATWEDFTADIGFYNVVKMYIYLSVKQAFDPPSSSFVLDSISRQIQEYTWRLEIQVEEKNYVPPVVVPPDE